MNETFTRYNVQRGSSEVLQVPDNDRFYVVGSVWQNSVILRTVIEGVHDDADQARLHAQMLSNARCFWTIAREPGEPLRAFIVRTWGETMPGLSVEQLESLHPDALSEETVRQGYDAPYGFAKVLRFLVKNRHAAILAAHRENGRSIYYSWGDFQDIGPCLAGFYDPARRKVCFMSHDDIDWLAAAGELSK